jgi:predicted transcriptional regulator
MLRKQTFGWGYGRGRHTPEGRSRPGRAYRPKYVTKTNVAVDQLANLITIVHSVLRGVSTAPAPVAEVLTPAVPIRRSVQRDHVVCLECRFHGLTLRRHLRVRHGLDVAAYRARWKLAPDHPVTAPGYSERRSEMAKQLGLGRQPAASEAPRTPTRRGRPRRSRS